MNCQLCNVLTTHTDGLCECCRTDDRWIPACGGTEVPFTARNGRKLLYCYQPLTGLHAYLDCATDVILTDADAIAALGIFEVK
jgi:hypothetical protein